MSEDLLSYERTQRDRTLSVIIWTALVASIILGWFDLQFHTWVSVIALWSMALLCVPVLILNRQGRFYLSAALLSLVVLVVITVNLYDGDGVHDPGILAYPIFLMIGALLFGKKAAPYFAAGSIGSLVLIVYLETNKLIHPKIGPTNFGILVPMGVLLVAAAVIIWVIVDTIEKNLMRARASEAALRSNYDLTLEAWAKVMEYRDRETEGHSRRLVELTTRLARDLGINEEQTAQLRRGALLHDIGKLAIPDEILLKPGPLTKTERTIIQKHPAYAREMLAGIPFLQSSVEVAYCHHEHWDGTGYPQGLKAEQIPLLARIFAVVDTWDALRSDRVYRKAWSIEKVIKYSKQNAGTVYDPHILEVFLGSIQNLSQEAN
ncbi:MAG TPA: HD-GYP domain-containing protein [Anaerolineales bacterium]